MTPRTDRFAALTSVLGKVARRRPTCPTRRAWLRAWASGKPTVHVILVPSDSVPAEAVRSRELLGAHEPPDRRAGKPGPPFYFGNAEGASRFVKRQQCPDVVLTVAPVRRRWVRDRLGRREPVCDVGERFHEFSPGRSVDRVS